MKKFLLIIFMAMNVLIMAGASVLLVERIRPHALPVGIFVRRLPSRSISPPAPQPPSPATPAPTRKILFSYGNSKAKTVMIRADFTGGKDEPMQRDEKGIWKYTATLQPGEYAYCFAVDGKSVRDPANKRTKKVEALLVSALLVTAPPSAPQH